MTKSLADFLLDNSDNLEKITHVTRAPKSSHPKGWEPGVVWSGTSGVLVSKPRPEEIDGGQVDHASLLAEWGFDVDLYRIDGPLQFRTWDANVGGGDVQRMKYYKCNIVPIRASSDGGELDDLAMESLPDLIKQIRGHKKSKRSAPTGSDAFVVCLSDWQIGGTDLRGGSLETKNRIIAMIDNVEDRVRELRKIGREIGTLYVFGLGDLVEKCGQFYSTQAYTTDLNETEQKELAVQLIIQALKQWSPLFERVVVASVVGNHGEVGRQGGKSTTDRVRDNTDTEVFRVAALVLAESPERYGHVSFVMPKDRSTLCLDVAGVTVGLAHGNQYTSPAAVQKWWANQVLGLQPVADATILITGHFHHMKMDQYGPRLHIQTPAMDNSSRWFAEGAGLESPSGTVTFVVREGVGLADLQVVN